MTSFHDYIKANIKSQLPPIRKNEDWKYTHFELDGLNDLDTSGFSFDTATLTSFSEYNIVLANNEAVLENLPKSVILHDSIAADVFESFHSSYRDTNYMSLLASQLSGYNKSIFIPKKQEVALSIISKTSQQGLSAKSLYIEVSEDAVADLNLLYLLDSASYSFDNIVVCLKQRAAVDLNLLHACPTANLYSKIKFICEQDSQLRIYGLDVGANKLKQELHVYIEGSGVHVSLNGAYCLSDEDHIENFIRVYHNQPASISMQNYKGILDKKSTAVFDASIYVAKGADHTKAEQLNKNLLLAKTAEVNTKPQLEIYADDVKCSHGATISRFLDDEIFYFLSRGISEDIAIDLLAKGFLKDCLVDIKSHYVQKYFIQYLQNKLESMGSSLHD